MHSIIKKSAVCAFATGAVVLGGMTAPAQAADRPPIAVGNLVNVQISNLLNNNEVVVAVPINAAAAICGVQVGVLAELGSATECDARGNQQVEILQ